MGITDIADIILYYPINIGNLHTVITLFYMFDRKYKGYMEYNVILKILESLLEGGYSLKYGIYLKYLKVE